MNVFKLLICLMLIGTSCTTGNSPEAVRTRLVADEDFKKYVDAHLIKISSASSGDSKKTEEAEQNSFKYYQRLYKNYVSKNKLTTQELNEEIRKAVEEKR